MMVDTKKYNEYFEKLDVKGADAACFKCKQRKSVDEWYTDLYYKRVQRKKPDSICGSCLSKQKEHYQQMEAKGVDILGSIKAKKKVLKDLFLNKGLKPSINTKEAKIDLDITDKEIEGIKFTNEPNTVLVVNKEERKSESSNASQTSSSQKTEPEEPEMVLTDEEKCPKCGYRTGVSGQICSACWLEEKEKKQSLSIEEEGEEWPELKMEGKCSEVITIDGNVSQCDNTEIEGFIYSFNHKEQHRFCKTHWKDNKDNHKWVDRYYLKWLGYDKHKGNE